MADGLRYVFGQRSIASLMMLMVLAGIFGDAAGRVHDPGRSSASSCTKAPRRWGVSSRCDRPRLACSARSRCCGSPRRPNKGEPLARRLPPLRGGDRGHRRSRPRCRSPSRWRWSAASPASSSSGSRRSSSRRRPRTRCARGRWRSGRRASSACSRSGRSSRPAWPPGSAPAERSPSTGPSRSRRDRRHPGRPEVRWLGCAALPEACVAATDPAAFAFLEEAEAAKVA